MATMIVKEIPDEVRNAFKACCAAQGKTIKAELVRLMKEAVEKYNKDKA